ncbi:hypothetical protein BLY22_002508 [Escherichia coli]|nr:hypothetical protein [Escherichia coli]EFL6361586.1 hypothetical protein [Escherichia coli]
MSTITKEWLQRLIRAIDSENFDEEEIVGRVNSYEIMELARIALASLEAEAVPGLFIKCTEIEPCPGKVTITQATPMPDGKYHESCFKLYAAPPAPVSVPDEAKSRELFEKWCSVNIERNKWHPEHYAHLPAREQWGAWEACRAAMLQGADGNSPVIPDGWVVVPEEPTHEMLEAGDEQFGTYDVYRRMIAAAPQQEVK